MGMNYINYRVCFSDAPCQVSDKIIGFRVLQKTFSMYGHGGHLIHVTLTINVMFDLLLSLSVNTFCNYDHTFSSSCKTTLDTEIYRETTVNNMCSLSKCSKLK